jgi:hypothetical protein
VFRVLPAFGVLGVFDGDEVGVGRLGGGDGCWPTVGGAVALLFETLVVGVGWLGAVDGCWPTVGGFDLLSLDGAVALLFGTLVTLMTLPFCSHVSTPAVVLQLPYAVLCFAGAKPRGGGVAVVGDDPVGVFNGMCWGGAPEFVTELGVEEVCGFGLNLIGGGVLVLVGGGE